MQKQPVDFDTTPHGNRFPVVWRDEEGEECDPCPFCGAQHIHGVSDGHRVAHCRTPGLGEGIPEDKRGGHWIVTDEENGQEYSSERGYIVKTRTE